jgi:hypothetical protein
VFADDGLAVVRGTEAMPNLGKTITNPDTRVV